STASPGLACSTLALHDALPISVVAEGFAEPEYVAPLGERAGHRSPAPATGPPLSEFADAAECAQAPAKRRHRVREAAAALVRGDRDALTAADVVAEHPARLDGSVPEYALTETAAAEPAHVDAIRLADALRAQAAVRA